MKLYNFLLLYFLRQWHPTPVLLPGKSHGRRSLVGCSPCGRWGSGTWLSDFTFTFHFHGEGNGNPLQCSCLENPRGRRAWWAAVYGVTQSRTWLKWLSSSSFLATPHGMWDLGSPTKDWIHAPTVEAWSPNYWTTREVPQVFDDKIGGIKENTNDRWNFAVCV